MKIALQNPSHTVRNEWTPAVVPREIVRAPSYVSGTATAIAGHEWGRRGRIVHVKAGLDAFEHRVIDFEPGELPRIAFPPVIEEVIGIPPIGADLPFVHLEVGGFDYDFAPTLHPIEVDGIRSVWVGSQRMGSLVAYVWFYNYPGQRIDWELLLTHSDPSNARMELTIQDCQLQAPSGLAPHVWWGAERGGASRATYGHGSWSQRMLPPVMVADGQGIAFKGFLAVTPQQHEESVFGWVDALSTEWAGHWGPWGVLPDLHPAEDTDARLHGHLAYFEWYQDFVRHTAKLRAGGYNPFTMPDYQLLAVPRNTGGRYQFGNTTMAPAVAPLNGGPYHIQESFLSGMYEAGRPSYFYERSGLPIDPPDHPDCVFWGFRPDFRRAVSPDQLGKEDRGPWHNNTLWVKDFEHACSNTLAGTALLSGSYMLKHICEHELTAHRLSPRLASPARAVGRQLKSLAWIHEVLDSSWTTDRMRVWLENPRWDEYLTGHPDWQVRPLSWTPDDRGKLGGKPIWLPWQEHSGIEGLDCAQRLEVPRASAILHVACRNAIEWGWWDHPELGWVTGDAIHYLTGADEGQALSPAQYGDPMEASPHTPGTDHDRAGWGAVLIARRVLSAFPDLVAKCDSILATLDARRLELPAPQGFDPAGEYKAVAP